MMLLKMLMMKIPRSFSRLDFSPFPLYIEIILANCIILGISNSAFTLLNISNRELNRSVPITPGLKISLINEYGSLDLFIFRDFSTFSRSWIPHGWKGFIFTSSSLFAQSRFFKDLNSSNSRLAGRWRNLCT